MKRAGSILQVLLFGAGVCLFVLAVFAVDPRELFVLVPAVAGPGALVFALYPALSIWDVWGWKILFPPVCVGRVKSWDLLLIRIAGEALNNVTPFVDVGGEPLKVLLSAERFDIPKRSALSATIMARTSLLFSEILFVAVGLMMSAFLLPLSPAWRGALFASMVLFSAAGGLLAALQKKGFFIPFLHLLERAGFGSRLSDEVHVPLREADGEITEFYARRSGLLWRSVAWHFVGWLAGGVEIMIMLHLVGAPVTFAQGVMLEALLQLVKTATFFIPGNLGTQEGGMALFLQALGFHPACGVAVSLLKRVRQFIWTGVGFLIWAAMRPRHSAEGARLPGGQGPVLWRKRNQRAGGRQARHDSRPTPPPPNRPARNLI